ncbi:MAG: PorT family protein [Calditrichia bacterium]|nr:PorT family protein [Calditrichia bacterium]
MKQTKVFITIMLLFFLFQLAYAQIEIGLIGGINRASLSGDKPKNTSYTSLSSGMLGAIFEVGIAKDVRFGIQPMLLQKGTKIAYKNPDERDPVDSLNFKIDYFTVPLMFKVISGNQKTYLSSGLEVGFPLNASLENLDGSGKTDVLDKLESIDVAVNFGFGARFPIKRMILTLELRYTQGLTNLNKGDEEDSSALDFVLRSTGLQFFGSISLPLGKIQ